MRLFLLVSLLVATITETSAQQRNITGDAFPLVAPSDAVSSFKIIVNGVGFGTASSQPSDLLCRMKIPDFEAPLQGPTGPARVINDTAIECTLTGYLTFGEYGIAVESKSHEDPAKKIWWSHGTANLQIRTLIEATPDKRPFMSDDLDEAELLLAVDIGAISAFPGTADATTFTVCAKLTANKSNINLPGNPYLPSSEHLDPSLEGLALLPCRTMDIHTLPGGSDIGSDRGTSGIYNTSILAVPFNPEALKKLPESVAAANVKISITIGKDFKLKPKYRRFSVAPSSKVVPGQSLSVVCHKRRMIRVNNAPWVGVGFYVSGTLALPSGKKDPSTGKPIETHNVTLGKTVYSQLARQGITQIMPYGMDVLTTKERAEIVEYLDKDLNASTKFDMPLVSDVVLLLNSTVGSQNYSQAWASIKAKVMSVKHSKSLLGYYICDDCNNAGSFPPAKMAWLYQALKALDPFHVVLGAPWARPWSLYQYGDDAGTLALDYMQVENYIPQPGYHQGWDERMRAGLFWEPIANSPPSYVLEGDDPHTGKDFGGDPWPAVLESTLSWLGVIEFGAVNMVNFVIEPIAFPSLNAAALGVRALNMQSHVNAVGNYARQVRKLLDALLPDLTDNEAGQPFGVAVEATSPCTASLPAMNGRPAVDLSKIGSVVAKGFQQRWVSPVTKQEAFCGFVVVANLCETPSSYTLRLGSGVPLHIDQAHHQFDANYNITISAARGFADIVPAYGTSVLRLGCDGFIEGCDRTGRVC